MINQNFKNPYTETWNFAVQRALPVHLVLDVAYRGRARSGHGRQRKPEQHHQPAQLGLGTASQPLYVAVRQNGQRDTALGRDSPPAITPCR